jgi:DNA modification methylase
MLAPTHSNSVLQVSEIIPYSRNSRTHSDAQISQIAASIQQFGFTNPVLVDEGMVVVAGHGRLQAVQRLGWAEIPGIVLTGLSDAQKAALRVADNKLALNAGWDDDLLRTELMGLRDVGFDLALTGFGEDELATLFVDRSDGLTDPDDVPEAPAEPVTRAGDVWLLGRHRLVCGDATNETDVSLCIGAVKPHLMVTDPPYGVDYDPDWRNERARTSVGMGNRAIGAGAVGLVVNDDRADWGDAWLLFPGDVIYVWSASLFSHVVADTLIASGFALRSQIIWDKTRLIIGRGDYQWQHEPCWYAVRKGKVGHWAGDRKQTTIWQVSHQRSETGHSTQKPVECMRRPIENNSSPGQAVYDPFVGSGTTIIAAEMTGRACHAIEISPAYCDVTVLRWQAFTVQTATRPDGTPFGAHDNATDR